jgi:RNase H-like domain found in reverse transcriptase
LLFNRQSDVIIWGNEQQQVWDKIKISLYNRNKESLLMTDASQDFVGGTLMQREDDGELHLVMYAIRKCQD